MVAVRPSKVEGDRRIGEILLLHDDPFVLHSLSACLRRHGFRVSAAESAREALALAAADSADVVLIGSACSGDAAEIARRLRIMIDAPLYVLADCRPPSSASGPPAAGAGVRTLPFCDEPELIAHLHAVLRRRAGPQPVTDEVLAVGDLEICPAARTVTRLGRTIDLTPIEFRLLTTLARERGKAVADRRLLTEVWGPEYAEDVQNLRIYIRYLRAKIEDDPDAPRYIVTERPAGYRLVAPSR
jgi:two-component system, OmpR family, KDP operon response regulator KdpE